MLHMSNLYYFTFYISLIFMIFTSSLNKLKIETTMSFINEELILDCVSYKGLIDSIEENDPKYMYINQEKLKNMVDTILSNNLNNIDYTVYYYFYDYSRIEDIYIDKQYYNSVQIKFVFNYQKNVIEKVLRFEPKKEGD